MKKKLSIQRVLLTLSILSAFAFISGDMPAYSEGAKTITSKGETIDAVTTFEGTATQYGRRTDKFSVGYYVNNGTIIKKNSLLVDKDTPASSMDLDITAKGEGINAVIATGKETDITLTGSISASDDGDGKNASDFTGLGAMIIAFDHAKVKVNSMKIDTKGFARSAFISDTYGQIFVKNSTITTMGANPLIQAYKGYTNSADTNKMISPPWVLGIQGGVRASNMGGKQATLTLIDSKVSSGGWAVLSTDGCTSPVMNVLDSTLEILPASKGGMSSGKFSYNSKYGSGYGTYLIGDAVQYFYGATISGTTYASIYTGGYAYYKSSKGKIELKDGEGKPIETVAGKGKPTTINSVFGFMTHGQACVNVLDGTVVNTEDAIFLNKASGAIFIADNAVLNSASGVILQMIDNDDRTVGGSMEGFNTEFKEAAGWPSESGSVTKKTASTGSQGGMGGMPGMPGGQGGPGGSGAPGAAAGAQQGGMPGAQGGQSGPGSAAGGRPGGMPGVQNGPEGSGASGAPGALGAAPSGQQGGMPGVQGGPGGSGAPGGMGGMPGMGSSAGYSGVKLALRNGTYKGNVFNGSGYYKQTGNALDVHIGKGATLTGAVSLTETRHIDETGKQNTHFTINEYYYLGHVENRNYRNETATISVSLTDGGKWVVTGESLINKLSVCCGNAIEGANGARVVMKIDGKEKPIEAGKVYNGNIIISLMK
jgi:hypothetical protein